MANLTCDSEVFQVAMDMEQVGRDFYEALAMGSDNLEVRKFCARTAKEEEAHYKTFQRLRDQQNKGRMLSERTLFELQQMGKSIVQPSPSAVKQVAIGGSLKDALEMAINMEKNAIYFYQTLSNNQPEIAEVIKQVIKEEQSHLAKFQTFAQQLIQ
jgi:rubrerythrin